MCLSVLVIRNNVNLSVLTIVSNVFISLSWQSAVMCLTVPPIGSNMLNMSVLTILCNAILCLSALTTGIHIFLCMPVCHVWFNRQVKIQNYLKKLFLRHMFNSLKRTPTLIWCQIYAERKNNLHCSHLCIHHLNDPLSIIMVQLDQLFIVITVCFIHWKSHRKKNQVQENAVFSTGHKHLCFTVLPSLHLKKKKKTLIGWYFIPQLSILLLAKDAISSRFQKCFMVYWETSVLNDKYMSYDK